MGWIRCGCGVPMDSSGMLTPLSLSSRRLLLPAQVAQGALLRAFLRPPQNHVLFACEGPPRQVQRTSYPKPLTVQGLCLDASAGFWLRLFSLFLRPVHYPSARMTRSGLSGASTRVGRARSPRSTAKNGSSTSNVCIGTRPTAQPHPSASTLAMWSLPP